MAFSLSPWEVEQHMIEDGDMHIVASFDPEHGSPVPIAEILTGDEHETFGRKEAEANAKLIAAAPELFQALRDLHSDVVSLVECIEEIEEDGGNAYDTHKTRQLLGIAHAAIQKATE